MTLNDLLLERLANWRPTAPRQTLDVTHPASGWTVSATAETADTVGLRLWEVNLTPGAQPAEELSAWAARTASRVTGLLEPLRLVEVEPGRAVQLRSATPTRRADQLAYYEVLRQRNGATSVRRYQAPAGGGTRHQVDFALTHEGLAQLAGDLAG